MSSCSELERIFILTNTEQKIQILELMINDSKLNVGWHRMFQDLE
jgi:hypothetical protein